MMNLKVKWVLTRQQNKQKSKVLIKTCVREDGVKEPGILHEICVQDRTTDRQIIKKLFLFRAKLSICRHCAFLALNLTRIECFVLCPRYRHHFDKACGPNVHAPWVPDDTNVSKGIFAMLVPCNRIDLN